MPSDGDESMVKSIAQVTSRMDNVVLTLDVDWAPDATIDFVARQLIEHQVRATWFVTHRSPAIERLRAHPSLFELGIHPNFLSGSTHGDTPLAVLRHCLSLVPDAVSLRTHALVQSTPIFDLVLRETGILADVSLFLPRALWLCPILYRRWDQVLVRVPYFWEDDFEMDRGGDQKWHLAPLLVGEGLKVFAFHPVHVYMNSAEMGPYQTLKQQVPRLAEAVPVEIQPFIRRDGEGTQTLFIEVVEHLAKRGGGCVIRDIARNSRRMGKEAV